MNATFIRNRNGEFSVEPMGSGYIIAHPKHRTLVVKSADEVFKALGGENGELELIEAGTGNSVLLSPIAHHDRRGSFFGTLVNGDTWIGTDVFFASLKDALTACFTGNAKSGGLVF